MADETVDGGADADEGALESIAELLAATLPEEIADTEVAYGELTVTTTPTGLVTLLKYLKDAPSGQFTTLVDISGVDYPDREKRFDIVYHLLSIPQNQRIRVKLAVREDEAAPSITGLYPAADWYEREVFDMYGVVFTGHPDLRRILTDYGFRGYPLRKDFPTTGFTEVRYDEARKRVVYEPVKLVQEYRMFDFMSPWEGAQYVLPGDEKGEGAN